MNLINITPKMTGYSTPAPYYVRYDNYDATLSNYAWEVFDSIPNSYWWWSAGARTNWVDLWFDSDTRVDYVEIQSGTTYWVTSLTIYGTNDRVTYTPLKTVTGLTKESYPLLIEIPEEKREEYKCYRVSFDSVNHTSRYAKVEIREIIYYQDSDYKIQNSFKEKLKKSIKNNNLMQNTLKFYIEKGE